MPILQDDINDTISVGEGRPSAQTKRTRSKKHIPKIKETSNFTTEWYQMVHEPIPIPKAMKIPAAQTAVENEWRKLEEKQSWLTDTVRSKKSVIEEAKRTKKQVHFGSLMDLCHLKNAELAIEFQKYKGRVVFRGDIVKDQDGHTALSSD